MFEDNRFKIMLGVGIGGLIALLMCCMGGCHSINEKLKLNDDNPLEQGVEAVLDAVVEKELGVNPHIDLTP